MTLGLATVGCYGAPGLEPSRDRTLAEERVALASERIELHLVRPVPSPRARPLILYATGDGGWRSADRQLFAALADWGYPLAGFAAPTYLKHFRDVPGVVTPAHVAEDYLRLADSGLERLGLPAATPIVLMGFSRGADLAIVAASRPELRARLMGVVVVALLDVEENVHRRPLAVRPGLRPELFEPFAELPALGPTPVVVIQSTRDKYLPAASARRLFGSDSAVRRFIPVEARGHTFSGAREELLRQVGDALGWVTERASGPGGAHPLGRAAPPGENRAGRPYPPSTEPSLRG